MKLSEYIKMLQDYSEVVDDLEVCMTQSGYYSDGEFAYLYDKPEVSLVNKQFFIVLGHSQQSY